MSKQAVEAIYPLSPMQQGMLFHTLYAPSADVYVGQLSCTLRGDLDTAVFKQAWQQTLDRHPVLRTLFAYERHDKLLQIVRRRVALPWAEHDWRDRSAESQRAALDALLAADRTRGFDLTKAPLLRLTLIRMADDRYSFVWSHHHIVLDGWSLPLVIRDVFALYEALRQGRAAALPVSRPYREYIGWLKQQDAARAERFWRETLAGFTTPTPLDLDRPAQASGGRDDAMQQRALSATNSAALQAVGRQHGLTLSTIVQGAWALLLSRYSRENDVVFGVTVSGRPPDLAGSDQMVGLLINTLPVRVRLAPDQRTVPWLQALQAQQVEQRQYEYSSLAEIQSWSDVPRGQALFQSIVVFESYPADAALQSLGGSLAINDVRSFETTNYPLTLVALPGPELTVKVGYDRQQFDDAAITRLLDHLAAVLESLAVVPDQRLGDLSLLPLAARARLPERSSRTAYPHGPALHLAFEAQAARTPDASAVTLDGTHLTYADLNRRANQVAHALRRLGVKPETPVGLCMERSPALIVGLLGILKAGGCYVPLDPAYPLERLQFMLRDTGAAVVLTQQRFSAQLAALPTRQLVIDGDWSLISQESIANPSHETTPGNLAYVIYTSGSTGTPKGVMVAHAQVLRLFAATQSWFHFDDRDVWTLFHSAAFDFSVWEIWGALLHGGRLVIVPYTLSRTPEAFYDLLCRERVTVLNQTPSAFRQLIPAEETSGCASKLALRLVIFGGEALDLASLRPWFARHGDQMPQLVNMYGITETTVHVTYRALASSDLEHAARSVIGGPIPDLDLYVLDHHGQPAPIGVAGELHVGGAGLARGYLGRPDLTAERFVPDPWSQQPGARLYRTGDLARALPSGDLEYLGRRDQQVKIRGFRIEPGEIEAVLRQHPAIGECVGLAREDDGHTRLVAYVVANKERAPSGHTENSAANDSSSLFSVLCSPQELREFLGQRLPDYMVPSAFVFLDALPVTTNGKLDRTALPAPGLERPELEAAFVAPRTPTQELLAEVWQQVLGVDRIGIHDNFFGLGGDSIRSIQVRALAHKLGIDLSIEQLFQRPTIAALAQAVQPAAVLPAPDTAPLSLLAPSDREKLPPAIDDAYPLALLQSGMVYHSALHPESATYHDVFGFHLRQPFVLAAFEAALRQLVATHPMLRTSFDLSRYGKPVQLVHRTIALPVIVEDLRGLTVEAQAERLAAWRVAEQQRGFAWDAPPLWRIFIHRRADDAFEFTLSFHHAILDGWSVAAMLTELFRLYRAALDGTATESGTLRSSYRDFIALERATLESAEARAFWDRKLADATIGTLPSWPGAVPADGVQEAQIVPVPLDADVSAGLLHLARSAGLPIKSVLLAAHLRAMSLLSGQIDVLTGVVVNGRIEIDDGDRVLGLFLNTLPLRLRLTGGSWTDLARQAFTAEQEAFPFRRYPLAELQKQQGVESFFEVIFNYVSFHVFHELGRATGVELLSAASLEQTNYPIVANFGLDGGGNVTLGLHYDASRLGHEQMRAIGEYYAAILRAMATTPNDRYESCWLLPEIEQRRLLVDWNATERSYPRDECIHQLVEAQVARTPDAVAAIFAGSGERVEQLTYRELNDEANQLARQLQRLGCQTGELIGVYLERSLEMIPALLGVLKAGGVYVPLDTSYPQARVQWILSALHIRCLITQAAHVPIIHTLKPALPNLQQIICLDRQPAAAPEVAGAQVWTRAQLDGLPTANVTAQVGANDLAYIIFTSGSTGTPKGVVVRHQPVVNLIDWVNRTFAIGPADRILFITSLCFDLSVYDIFGLLAAGGSIHVVAAPDLRDPQRLLRLLRDEPITFWDSAPAALQQLAPLLPASESLAGSSLRLVFLSGDWIPITLPDQLRAAFPRAQVVGLGGATEATVWSNYFPIDAVDPRWVSIPYGRPIQNARYYVLDPYLNPCPVGVAGDLYIGGECLASGYIDEPVLTATKFIPDPFSQTGYPQGGAHLYATGDQARVWPDGTIEFLGRRDQQVKIRGFRIELGEIEAALRQHSQVGACVVVAREEHGHKRLVAYVVAHQNPEQRHTGTPEHGPRAARARGAGLTAELRAFLAARLPDYMVPSAFVVLDALPLTPNGKLDRPALPAPDATRSHAPTALVAPRTATERALAAIWAAVLRVAQVGRDDDFFALGGDSILSLQVVARAQAVGLHLTPKQLFTHPTLSALAAVVGTAAPVTARQDLITGPLPLTPIQHWFFAQALDEPHHFNQAVLLDVRQPLEAAALQAAVDAVLRHHDGLRLRVRDTERGPALTLAPPASLPVAHVDLAALPAAERQRALEAHLAEAQRGFDLRTGPLLRVGWYELGPAQGARVLVAAHHLVIDGVGWRILVGDLETAYTQAR
ncbi:MAG TPA: amino acid adenylation domain-containing protein, partial [Herpetosiphonaceae bacterium]